MNYFLEEIESISSTISSARAACLGEFSDAFKRALLSADYRSSLSFYRSIFTVLVTVNSMEIECDLTTIIIYSLVQYFILINFIIKVNCFTQIYSPVLMIKFVFM